jgi:Fe-S cluster assembly protein SufD
MAGKKSGNGAEILRIGKGQKGALVLEIKESGSRRIALEDGADAEIAVVNIAQAENDIESSFEVRVGKDAALKLLGCNFGGKETASSVRIVQREGSRVEHYEVALLSENQRLRASTDHSLDAPNAYSRSSFRYAAAGNAQVFLDGKVALSKNARGGDAHLVAKGLLLSPNAVVSAIPMLYVWNEDVKAGHGAAMAPVSEDELFYLNARGIDSAAGRRMILAGFLSEPAIAGKMSKELLEKLHMIIEKKMDECSGI